MSISLPSVIQSIPQQMDELKLPPPALAFKAQLDLPIKKLVICITRDISQADMAMLKDYGRVVEYDHSLHMNLPMSAFFYDYLIVDLRESGDRYFLLKSVLPFKPEYTVVVYSYAFEFDVVSECDNHISSFPKKQALKIDFDLILGSERISKPKWWVSLFSCMLSTYNGIKK